MGTFSKSGVSQATAGNRLRSRSSSPNCLTLGKQGGSSVGIGLEQILRRPDCRQAWVPEWVARAKDAGQFIVNGDVTRLRAPDNSDRFRVLARVTPSVHRWFTAASV